MGEIAEMMLDGTLCEGCGEYIGEGEGFPRYCCDACARGPGVEPAPRPESRRKRRRPARLPRRKPVAFDPDMPF